MKALIALRGSMQESDREHLLSLGYDVTWAYDVENIRQIESTSLRDYFAAFAMSAHIHRASFTAKADETAKYAYQYADAMLAEKARTKKDVQP